MTTAPSSAPPLDCGRRTHRPCPGHLRRARLAPARGHVRGGRPRDHGRLGRLADHRDRRGEGARRRAAGRIPDAGRPRLVDPAVHPGAHRHHRRHGGRVPVHRLGAALVPGVRARVRARRAQRPVRRRVPEGRVRGSRARLAGFPGRRHRPARPPGGDARRGAELQAGHPRAAVPGGYVTKSPGPVRRPGDRRRAARADGAPRRPRRALPRGTDRVLRPRPPAAAPQAVPGRGAADGAGGVPVRGRGRRGAVRRHVQEHPRPGAHVLHRVRAAQPHGRDGRPGRAGRADRVRHPAGGAGPRAAPDRRAQAALQPPVAVSRAGGVAQADGRGLPPPVGGPPGARRLGRVPRSVLVPAAAPNWR